MILYPTIQSFDNRGTQNTLLFLILRMNTSEYFANDEGKTKLNQQNGGKMK